MLTVLYLCASLCTPQQLVTIDQFYREDDCYLAGEQMIHQPGTRLKFYACVKGGWNDAPPVPRR